MAGALAPVARLHRGIVSPLTPTVAMNFPSAVNAIGEPTPLCSSSWATCLRPLASQILTVRSGEAVAAYLPLGAKATLVTKSMWPFRVPNFLSALIIITLFIGDVFCCAVHFFEV